MPQILEAVVNINQDVITETIHQGGRSINTYPQETPQAVRVDLPPALQQRPHSLYEDLAGKIRQETVRKPERKPYTFDLGEEHARVRQHGESYWEFFHKQAETYLREAYARVKITSYHHEVVKTDEGEYRIVFGPGKEDAVKSYAIPVQNTALPDWYRKRALADVKWAESMNAQLGTAEPGDVFVDASPTAFDVPMEERKKWNMTNHSFIRLHRVVDEDGVKKLISQTPRHYLDLPEQVELFKQLTGKDVEGSELLGTVGRLRSELGLGHVLQLVDKLYTATPEERKLIPTGRDLDEEEVERHLAEVQTWIRAVFDFMKQGKSRKEIVDHFQGLEKAFQRLVKGEKIVDLKKMKTRDFASKSVVSSSGVGAIMAAPYKAGASDCPGAGSGYGSETGGAGKMSYTNMGGGVENLQTYIRVKGGRYEEVKSMQLWELKNRYPNKDRYDEKYFKCPHCGVYNVRPEGELIATCYDCDKSVKCETSELAA